MSRAAHSILVQALVWLPVVCLAGPTGVETGIRYGPGQVVGVLQDERITESSGLACSRVRPGAFWTHNDSGGRARVFAFDGQGRSLGAWLVPGARAVDWEDIASVTIDGRSCLVIADTGDNQKRRKRVILYVVAEPDLKARAKDASAKLVRTIPFVYEHGPHDCEAVCVDPADKTVYLITKTVDRPCRVYALKWPSEHGRPATKPLVARAVAQLPLTMVTAMDMAPDGRRAIVLTYLAACEYVRREGETWAAAFARPPRLVPVPLRKQGEAICYGADGKTLYLTSEGKFSPLIEVGPVGAGKDEDKGNRTD